MPEETPKTTLNKILVLCGAHKTASTHLQRTLLKNKARLARAGAAVIMPKTVRAEIMPLVDRARGIDFPAQIKAELAATLAALAPGAKTVIICDENLLGGTDARMGFRGGRLYPWGAPRVARLLRILPAVPKRLAFGLRSMATFLPSAYAETLYHFDYQTFPNYLEGVDPGSLSWADLALRIREETEVPMTLWRFEDYPETLRAIVGDLLGHGVARDLVVDHAPARVGLSSAAVTEIARAHASGVEKPELTALKKALPKSASSPGLAPFSDREIAALNALYAADIQAISALPKVRVIRPG